MKNIGRILLCIVLATIFSGCSSLTNVFRGEPNIHDSTFLVVDKWQDSGTPSQCAGADNWTSPTNDDDIRRCTEQMKLLIDVRWAHYSDSLLSTISTGTTAFDVVQLGLTTAGSLTGANTTQILSAIASGLAGVKSTISEDLLYKNSIVLIILQMKKDRASWATIIQKQLNGGKYKNMYEAATDLYAYYRAGSWNEALTSMQSDSGAQEAACAAELKKAKINNGSDSAATATSPCDEKPSNATTKPIESVTSLFPLGGVTIAAKDIAAITALATTFKAGGYASIAVEGRADGTGTPERNTQFAQMRADAAKKVLTDAGIDASKITTKTVIDTKAAASSRAVAVALVK